ncbi:hypothetical protein K402DRAFT_256452 [Aulographum hederae CBS 113979]|uniref:Uncharacterized protein n=1 Tax=Aulographum hederae CBS 113979 TaxID=1176131 RepID=A0A6G1H9A6_9PEZI|nr:hypothetical protein K402DRAFT_256452 [Aulographum hederae CBS 113979]
MASDHIIRVLVTSAALCSSAATSTDCLQPHCVSQHTLPPSITQLHAQSASPASSRTTIPSSQHFALQNSTSLSSPI